jgi:predicted ArsR family transcriptional regulator
MENLSVRQQALLRLLHDQPAGLTIDDLADALGVSRPAVRQHLSALEADGLVAHGETRRTAGRPVQAYVLANAGRERFPRQYAWQAGVIVTGLAKRDGAEGLLRELAGDVADSLEPRLQGQDRVAQTLAIMNELGFNASQDGPNRLRATNCIYRAVAQECPEVCCFDVELISRLTGQTVQHDSCMVRGADDCRFSW